VKNQFRLLFSLVALTAISASAQAPKETAQTEGQALFEKIKGLTGEWVAPLGDNDKMVNIFEPFANGTKILATEWENGKHITSTVFYMVGTELRADHFCDYLNEPRYTLHPSPVDPSVVQFQFRSATNLDSHPVHFHSTAWRFVDNKHLIQDWSTEGQKNPGPPVHMEFTRTEVSVRSDGSPTLFPVELAIAPPAPVK
jgi:hypothetical protein